MSGVQLATADRRGNVVRVERANGETDILGVTEPLALVFDLELTETFDTTSGLTTVAEHPDVAVGIDSDGTFLFDFNGFSWMLSGDDAAALIRAVDTYQRTNSLSPLRQLHRQQANGAVRQRVVNAFVDHVDADVTVIDEGWLLDDLVVLTWNERLVPYTGNKHSPLAWDDSWQLYGFTNMDAEPPEASVSLGNQNVTLQDNEWGFIQRAAWVANREYFGQSIGFDDPYWRNFERAVERGGLGAVETTDEPETGSSFFDAKDPIIGSGGALLSGDVTNGAQDIPTDVSGAAPIYKAAREAAAEFRVGSYRSHTSGEPHSHTPTNHDARDVFNISDTLVANVLHFSPKDHGALHELVTRREGLLRQPVTVFTDTGDWDENRWSAIEGELGHAHIRDEVLVHLEAAFDR